MINSHFCKHFITHYWSATRIDVLHSPFVFDLYNSCIKHGASNSDFDAIEKLRSELQHDDRIIIQNDLGAGADKGNIKKNTISHFAKHHAKPARIAQIIYRLIGRCNYKNIIELGTSLGISSCYEASALKRNFGSDEVNFTTIEGATEIANIAAQNFRKMRLDNYIKLQVGNFDDVLPDVLKSYQTIDMAFVDGNHRYAPTISYFKQFLTKKHNDSLLIFDDIYWSKEMTKAWEEIKLHPDVTVTIDLFFIGLVFFRKEQQKEHFKLRIL